MERENGKGIFKRIIAVFMTAVMLFSMFTVLDLSAFAALEAPEGRIITSVKEYELAPGIKEQRIVSDSIAGNHQVKAYVAIADFNNPNVGFLAGYKDYDSSGTWGMQTVRDQAVAAEKATGYNVVAGINGDYFCMQDGNPTGLKQGQPYGALIMDGKVVNSPAGQPHYFAVLKDGTPVIRDSSTAWADVKYAIGAPLRIVVGGEVVDNPDTSLLPRSAIGITADNKVIIYTADGRQAPTSVGETVYATAQMMKTLGCVEAVYLDGGGASIYASQTVDETSMTVKSSPSDGTERKVSTTALLYYSAVSEDPDTPETPPSDSDECVCDGYVIWNFNRDTQKLGCPDCDKVFDLGDYSGFVNDKETGVPMRFMSGEPAKGWVAYIDDHYYFGEDGMAVTGQQVIDGKTYTFDEEGKFVKGSFVDEAVETSSGEEMILTRYYGPGGIPAIRWQVIDGELYYFSKAYDYIDLPEDGAMYRGGEFVIRTAGANSKRKFTFAVDGRLIGGCWEEEMDSNGAYVGKRYYWGPDYVTGDFKIDGVTYTFDEQGYLVTRDINVTTIEVDYSVPGAIEPGIVVTDNGGEVLTNGVHYTLSYQDNVGTCTGVIRIKGIKKQGYTGTKKVRFNIKHTAETEREIERKTEAVAPTCTETGFTAGTYCEVCQLWTSGHEVVPALGHTVIILPAIEPTCTSEGFTEGKKCLKCETVILAQQVIPAPGHKEVVMSAVDSTCTEPGLTAGKKCSVCDTIIVAQEEIPLLAHIEEVIPGKAETCTEKGFTDGKKCSVCGEITVAQTEIPASGHKTITLSALEATCARPGLTEGKQCIVCDEILVKQENVYKSHDEETISGVEATCINIGLTEGKKCKACNMVTVPQSIIPALGHKELVIPAVPATYTKSGLTEGKKCSVCGEILEEQKKIARKKLKKVTKVKAKKTTASSVTLSWKKVTGADSYKVYYSTNGKKWKSVKVTKNSATIKKLSSAKNYQFKVRAFAGKYYGEASKVVKATTKFTTATLSKVTSAKKKQASVNWKKTKNASGYVVEYSTSKNFTKKTTKTVTVKNGKTTKTTLKKLKSGKKYYVRVKAYKTVNKKAVYGEYSKVKTVKIK